MFLPPAVTNHDNLVCDGLTKKLHRLVMLHAQTLDGLSYRFGRSYRLGCVPAAAAYLVF